MKAYVSPKIKPSHKGLLHEDLGIAKGEKIGEKRLEQAKHSSNPKIRKRATFALNFNDNGTHGYVTHIGAHHERPDHYAEITVAHGRRRRHKDEKGKAMPFPSYDDRPTSRIVIPKAHAGKFHVGMHVGLGAVPLEGPDTDDMDPDDAQDDYDDMRRSIRTANPVKRRSS